MYGRVLLENRRRVGVETQFYRLIIQSIVPIVLFILCFMDIIPLIPVYWTSYGFRRHLIVLPWHLYNNVCNVFYTPPMIKTRIIITGWLLLYNVFLVNIVVLHFVGSVAGDDTAEWPDFRRIVDGALLICCVVVYALCELAAMAAYRLVDENTRLLDMLYGREMTGNLVLWTKPVRIACAA